MRVDTHEITAALRALGKANKRSGVRNLNLAGKLLTSFAYKHTSKASKQLIESSLKKPARVPWARRYKSRRGSKQWDGTFVAAIVGSKHRKKGKRTGAGAYYRDVAKFYRRKVNSAGYHRAGFIPALRSFKVPQHSRRRGRGRYLKPVPGKAQAARKSQGLRPRGFIENSARGIRTRGDVLRRQAPFVAAQLYKFARQDMKKNARRNGFRYSGV